MDLVHIYFVFRNMISGFVRLSSALLRYELWHNFVSILRRRGSLAINFRGFVWGSSWGGVRDGWERSVLTLTIRWFVGAVFRVGHECGVVQAAILSRFPRDVVHHYVSFRKPSLWRSKTLVEHVKLSLRILFSFLRFLYAMGPKSYGEVIMSWLGSWSKKNHLSFSKNIVPKAELWKEENSPSLKMRPQKIFSSPRIGTSNVKEKRTATKWVRINVDKNTITWKCMSGQAPPPWTGIVLNPFRTWVSWST